MASCLSKKLLLCILVCGLIAAGYSLECAACSGSALAEPDSREDICYRNPGNKTLSRKCDDLEDICATRIISFSKNESLTMVDRDCGSSYNEGCATVVSYLGYKEEICACMGDNCNTSSRTTAGVIIAVMTTFRCLLV